MFTTKKFTGMGSDLVDLDPGDLTDAPDEPNIATTLVTEMKLRVAGRMAMRHQRAEERKDLGRKYLKMKAAEDESKDMAKLISAALIAASKIKMDQEETNSAG
jgi:hypothetical protein